MNAWKRLNEYLTLTEDRKFLGKTAMRLKDLQKLGDEIGITVDPNGGSVRTAHKFDPSIWKPWYPDVGPAIAIASTDDKRDIQTGNPQGGTVHKTNWGGKVANVPAPLRPSPNDRYGSAMDRYDVLMVAEIDQRINAKGAVVPNAVMTRFCWSPSIGSQEERQARLQALAAGKPPPPLSRRPQGEVPAASPDDEERWAAQKARRAAADDAASEPGIAATDDTSSRGGMASNSAFRDKLAKHNAKFQPEPQRKPRAPDPEDALFWTPEKPKR